MTELEKKLQKLKEIHARLEATLKDIERLLNESRKNTDTSNVLRFTKEVSTSKDSKRTDS